VNILFGRTQLSSFSPPVSKSEFAKGMEYGSS
jgi:hypothetical protein